MTPFEGLYANLFRELTRILITDPGNEVPARDPIVPSSNICPADDPGIPLPGPQVVYAVSRGKTDPRTKKAECLLRFTVYSQVNKIEAEKILDLIRGGVGAKDLEGNGIRVALFKEIDLTDDSASTFGPAGSDPSKSATQAIVSVKFIFGRSP